ncbi:MAG: hypothetical protein HY248_02290, partial [Fimbriimonas ginsengisoli]|nr:hypothetical protein [Fimbriimonas ginsengisoli]
PYTDAAIQAGRYTLAHSAVSTAFHQDNRRADLANRLAYSQIRLSRYSDAYTTLRTLKRFGKYDAYSYALEAVTELCLGAEKEASDSIKEAILNNGDDLGVLTAQAYAALRRNDTAVLSRLVASLMQDHAQRTEVNTYLSALLNRTGRLEEARRYFIDAVKADPLNIDIYIQEANQSIQIGLTGKLAQADAMHELDTAETMFDAALTAHPESAEALTGMSIVRLFRLDYAGAAKLAKAANEASPSYGAALYVLACAHQNLRQSLIAQADMVAAGEIDGTHLRGHSPPSPQLAWRYFSTYGRTPLLTPPG